MLSVIVRRLHAPDGRPSCAVLVLLLSWK